MSLMIHAACNGWLVTDPDGEVSSLVSEHDDTTEGRVDAFVRLLWHLTEHYGMVGTKHDAVRVRITAQAREE